MYNYSIILMVWNKKNIIRTDIREKKFYEYRKRLKTTIWKLSTNNVCQKKKKKNTDRIP